MKFYEGTANLDSGGTVVVRDGDGSKPLKHHVRHSPDGFNWGYGGSGPSDLARCILIDYFGHPAPAEPLYQDFKFDVIASLPSAGWTLTELEIDEWIEGHEGTLLDRVLAVLDGPDEEDRWTTTSIGRRVGEDPLTVEAAISALLKANLCGEEPPGYFFTDERDPAYQERNR